MADDHHPEFVDLSPLKVFISYSHEDEEWKERLLENLKILIDKKIIECWHDDDIHGRENSSEKIFDAINDSKIAILLVSQKFLGSDFIQNEEVPRILRREKLGYIHIYPIMIKHCNWNKFDWLEKSNIKLKNAIPLYGMNENDIDYEFVKIIDDIEVICNQINNGLCGNEIEYNIVDNGSDDKFACNYKFVENSNNRNETAVLITNIGLRDLGRNGEPLYNHVNKSKNQKIGQQRREFYRKREKLIQDANHHDVVPQESSAIPRIEMNRSEYFKNLLNSKDIYNLDLLILTPLIENIKVEYNIKEIIIFYVEASFQNSGDEYIAHIVKKILCHNYGFDETKIKVEPVPITGDEEKIFNRYKNEIEKIPHNVDSVLFSLLGYVSRQDTSAILQAVDMFPKKTKLILELNKKENIYVYDVNEGTQESVKLKSIEENLKFIQNNEILRCIILSKIKIIDKLIVENEKNLNCSGYQFTKGIFLNDLGNLLLRMELTSEAIESFEKALIIFRELPTEFSGNLTYNSREHISRTAKILFNFGNAFLQENELEDAKSKFEESLELSKKLLEFLPNNLILQSLFLDTITKLIEIYLEIGEELPTKELPTKKESLNHALELCREYEKFVSERYFIDNRKIILEYKLKACLNLSLMKIKESKKKDAHEIYKKCIASVEKLKNNECDEQLIKLFNLTYYYLQSKKILLEAMCHNPTKFSLIEESIKYFNITMDMFKGNEHSELAKEIFNEANICFKIYSFFIEFRRNLNAEYEFPSNGYTTIEKNNLMSLIMEIFPNELDNTIKSHLEAIINLYSEKNPEKIKEDLAAINTSIEEIEQTNFRKILRIIFDEAEEILKDILQPGEIEKGKGLHKRDTCKIGAGEIEKGKGLHKRDTCKIGAVQIDFSLTSSFPLKINDDDKPRIKAKILQALIRAKEEKVNILCFPELCMCEEWLSEIENKCSDMIVIAGSYYNEQGHNVCWVIMDSDRNLLPAQFKITPSDSEDSSICGLGMVPGKKTNIYDETPFGKFAVLICRDFCNFRDSLRGKTDILFVPSCNPANSRFHQDADSHVRNSLGYVVIANVASEGGTSIFGQMDRKHFPRLVQAGYKEENDQSLKLCELKKNQEGIIIADFNLSNKSIPKISPIDPAEASNPVRNIKIIPL
ncbi:MAG: TIR domain-containing protein [Euryarchaeota archaeon]|nr:TIR domain-containing protein [Euryarchaeota archaeon]